ncbi:MAG TPA: DUF2497 domain-containing protein [Acidiphilium sp.]|uniref:DUF2497 domain-containing protein n=1 Tax=unclassified Acidiphilium TaxID=2617493 RepID=UPI000BDA908D|nr:MULTISPECIES: DUF2497 domain-containing protein [unclassified Acidiphilium]OYV54944.1 MAG: hypothetical protein B7Z76_12425 [Acidiphilium sp. 20-67-58]OYV87222.1 MAG: hypothetical protein B7Z64_01895 [Acidiphilium sp. 21-68-69]HQT61655.1 DUF2497 domain-containing protein [Acidiphilium sp.]HQU10607.1 DUF2497 domain-containing protein [Acidiphilium sp.]
MSGTPPDPAAEPSMDEILSSIRRILKDDDPVAMPAAETAQAGGAAHAAAKPVLDLDPTMMVAEGRIAPKPEGELQQGGAMAAGATLSRATPPGMATEQTIDTEAVALRDPERLVSPAAAQRAAEHIGTLRRTVAPERGLSLGRGDITVEDLVRAELRPMLKAWLDEHLPNVVERIVRSEIERLIGEDGP